MDTYWSRAARTNQLPPGMSVVENRLSQAGRSTEPGSMQNIAGPNPYGRPGDRPRTSLDDYLRRTADLQKAANDANQSRYDEGRRLLGLEDPDAWRKAGFASPDAYEAHRARLAGEAAATTPPALPGQSPAGVAATGGNITPQALASRVQAQQRGIYNSSTALNREAVTNSLALQDAAVRDRNLAMQAAQFDESRRRADQSSADQLRAARLEWIYNRNDAQPNLDRLQQIAATEGQGNTAGMQYPAAGGGTPQLGGSAYGGAAGGYTVPQNRGFYTDPRGRQPATTDDADQQDLPEYFGGKPAPAAPGRWTRQQLETIAAKRRADAERRRAVSMTPAFRNAQSSYGMDVALRRARPDR
jgi:hypothetical protein